MKRNKIPEAFALFVVISGILVVGSIVVGTLGRLIYWSFNLW